jgi:hypothetical protein
MNQRYGFVAYIPENIYFILGGCIVLGIFLLDYSGLKRGSKLFLASKSERLFLLALPLSIGFYFNFFEESFLVAIGALALLPYLVLVYRKILTIFKSIFSKAYDGVRLIGRGILLFKKLSFKEEYEVPKYRFAAVVKNRKSEPVMNAEVILRDVETNKEIKKYTDASGKADFNMPQGQYKVIITSGGLKSEYDRYISMDSGEVFTISKSYSDLSVVISDKEKATPVPNAKVTLIYPETNVKIHRIADNLGIAYFDELEIESYDIRVEAKDYESWERRIDLKAENVVGVNLVKKKKIDFHSLPTPILVEYSSLRSIERLVMKIVEDYLKSNRDVFLLLDDVNAYVKKFGDRIIVSKPPKETELKHLKPMFEKIPAGSMLIFDISEISHNHKFISETVEYFSREGLSLICLINAEVGENVYNIFEKNIIRENEL